MTPKLLEALLQFHELVLDMRSVQRAHLASLGAASPRPPEKYEREVDTLAASIQQELRAQSKARTRTVEGNAA
jgi:hypothetical protein